MRRVISFAIAVCVALVAARPAADSSPLAQSAPRAAVLDAFVVSRQGEFVPGLTAADFRVVTADGKQIPITHVRQVSIPAAHRGTATAVPPATIEASNQHTRDARLFVVIYELLFYQSGRRSARNFLDELVSMKADDDQVALFVAGRPELNVPPTADPYALARAFDRLPEARIAFEPAGLTSLVLNDLPGIYDALIATRWTQRAIVLLSPGGVHPAGLRDYRSWEAWSLRANAPMHGVDPLGSMPEPGLGAGDHVLLRQATQETKGLLFINHGALKGVAPKILAASSRFYQVEIDLPEGVPADQSLFMSVRTHPTASVRSRRRVRSPVPDPTGARASDELRKALEAPLPMDEVPISASLGGPSGSTSITIRFLGDPARTPDAGIIELPAMPVTVAVAAVSSNERVQMLGSRRLGDADLRVEGCCATVREDVVIPKNAIAVRVAVYQHASGRSGAVFLPVNQR